MKVVLIPRAGCLLYGVFYILLLLKVKWRNHIRVTGLLNAATIAKSVGLSCFNGI